MLTGRRQRSKRGRLDQGELQGLDGLALRSLSSLSIADRGSLEDLWMDSFARPEPERAKEGAMRLKGAFSGRIFDQPWEDFTCFVGSCGACRLSGFDKLQGRELISVHLGAAAQNLHVAVVVAAYAASVPFAQRLRRATSVELAIRPWNALRRMDRKFSEGGLEANMLQSILALDSRYVQSAPSTAAPVCQQTREALSVLAAGSGMNFSKGQLDALFATIGEADGASNSTTSSACMAQLREAAERLALELPGNDLETDHEAGGCCSAAAGAAEAAKVPELRCDVFRFGAGCSYQGAANRYGFGKAARELATKAPLAPLKRPGVAVRLWGVALAAAATTWSLSFAQVDRRLQVKPEGYPGHAPWTPWIMGAARGAGSGALTRVSGLMLA
eukprot:Skav206574  [mRNA]  locus=scaffold925:613998:622328:- [translate_table: standard]